MRQRIILIGYMGTGKSTIGKKLSEELGLPFFDTDTIIEKNQKMTVYQLFETIGEDNFRELEKKVIHEMQNHQSFVLATGGGLPCYNDNIQFLNELGLTIYIKNSTEELVKRLIIDKDNRPLLKNKNEEELYNFVKSNLEVREQFYNQSKVVLTSNNHDLQSLKEIIRLNYLA